MSGIDDLTSIATLKEILDGTEIVMGEDGAFYATFTRDGRLVTYPTFSSEFMTWYRGEAVQRLNSVPGTRLVKQAIEEAEHKVQMVNLPYPVASRFHADETTAVIHLGRGVLLEIDAKGAKTRKDANIESGIIFPTRPSMHSLPKPEDGDVLEVLAEFLDLPEDQCRLALIWLMSLFQPDGRYPILFIIGSRQSGKTWLATVLRRLLDPHPVPLLSFPKDQKELKAAVLDNAILAFDNVEKMPLQHELLALAKGTALTLPGWSRPVQCKRPIIVVCDKLPDAPDLLENALVLRLKARPAKAFKSKSELDRIFHRQHGKAFGSLVMACTLALQNRKTVELDAVHKDAELEKWIVALDNGLDLGGKLMGALQHNLEQTLTDIIQERPALRAFHALVQAKGSVKATATELLVDIEPFLDGPKDARYPTSGKALAKLLRDHKRFMTSIEIDFVRSGKDGDRNIVATWLSPKTGAGVMAAPPSRTTPGRHKKTDGASQDQPRLL